MKGKLPGPLGLPASRTSQMLSASAKELRESRLQGHSVPEYMRERRGSAAALATAATTKVRAPSHAEQVRTLMVKAKHFGVLATTHHDPELAHAPFGSIVNVAVDPSSKDVFFFASRLAEHTANLERDPRASVLFNFSQGEGDRLSTSRATLVGEAKRVEKTPQLVRAFRDLHPNAAYVAFDDFHAYVLTTKRVRYIAGFGEMSWVSRADFLAAEPDPIAVSDRTAGAVSHLNEAHQEDVKRMVRVFGGPSLKDATAATVLSIDRYGLEILAETPTGRVRGRLGFDAPLSSADQLQENVVGLSKKSRL